jgi:hypothetical protein
MPRHDSDMRYQNQENSMINQLFKAALGLQMRPNAVTLCTSMKDTGNGYIQELSFSSSARMP